MSFAMSKSIQKITEELCREESYQGVFHSLPADDVHMPALAKLEEGIDLLRSVLFPGFFLQSEVKKGTLLYYTGSTLDQAIRILSEQIKRGYCFSCTPETASSHGDCCPQKTEDVMLEFVEKLPEIRRLLATDVEAAYVGDPAAKSRGEVIFAYPSLYCLTLHRIAHVLYELNVPLIPRILSEMAHARTGIDIHPGALIGESFFIDHGTGTVIGETTVIGKNVRIYQGVTLGAKSFPTDDRGRVAKGLARHPVVEDNVVIYAGAIILGRITIGKNSVVGGNSWITDDIPAETMVHSKKEKNTLIPKA